MCGAYGFSKKQPRKFWQERYGLVDVPDHNWTSYNIRPSMQALVIREDSPTQARLMTFGFPMPWDETKLLINAKSETVHTLRTYKPLLRGQRCLVPADVFYEWKRLPDGKQPYAFARDDDSVFSLAGLYTDRGFVILTTRPNRLMTDVHNRMPCMLRPEDERQWLDPDTGETQFLALLAPYPDAQMRRWAISSLVNKASNNFPEILKPVAE